MESGEWGWPEGEGCQGLFTEVGGGTVGHTWLHVAKVGHRDLHALWQRWKTQSCTRGRQGGRWVLMWQHPCAQDRDKAGQRSWSQKNNSWLVCVHTGGTEILGGAAHRLLRMQLDTKISQRGLNSKKFVQTHHIYKTIYTHLPAWKQIHTSLKCKTYTICIK